MRLAQYRFLPSLVLFAADGVATGGAPAVKVTEEKPLTLGEQLRAAVSSKATLGRQIDELREESGAAAETITRMTEELATATRELDEAKAAVTALTSERDLAVGKVKELEAAKKTVGQEAREKLSELGVPAAELPASTDPAEGDGESDAAIYARWQAAKGGEKTALLRANRDALLRHEKTLRK
jgi:chromosome segregation ATPase